MSDINIPGVTNSRINTQKMIDAIMNSKRVPLKRMETELEDFKKTKKVWQDLNLEITKLKDSANELYSFDSPFSAKKGTSSDESVLTAVPTRKAVVTDTELRIKQIATADRFMSSGVPKDFKVKEGAYRFNIGEKEISIAFHGGSLTEFAEAVNKKGGKYLRLSVVNNTPSTSVLVIESLLTGGKNKLSLHDAALDLAESTGMFKRIQTSSLDVPLTNASVNKSDSAGAGQFQIENGALTVRPQSHLQIPVRPPFPLNKNMALEYEVKSTPLSEAEIQRPSIPPGPTIPETGSIEYKGIKIYSEKSIVILPEEKKIEPPKRVDDMSVLSYASGNDTKALPDVADTSDFVTVRVPIGADSPTIESITVDNTNTHRTVSLRRIRIFDPTARGDYAPTNPLAEAHDAIIEYNGVEIVRDSNTVSDLIPEVTINLHDKSDKKVKLSVKYDTEAMKASIIAFVGSYDRLITEVDILTRSDDSIIENAAFLSDAEKEKATERLALLKGDLTLRQLKSNLQTIMMNAYKTSSNEGPMLLAQVGISTNTLNTGIDKTTLRGYLQIDESKLDSALTSRPEIVKDLFGYDQDRDLIIDTGVAFSVDSYAKPYVRTGGIIATRLQTLDTQLTRKNREINDFKRTLDDYERQLKLKYGKMEGAIEELQKSNEALRNLNSQNK